MSWRKTVIVVLNLVQILNQQVTGKGCVAQEFANLFNGGGVDLSSFGVWYRATAAFTGMMETFGLSAFISFYTPRKNRPHRAPSR